MEVFNNGLLSRKLLQLTARLELVTCQLLHLRKKWNTIHTDAESQVKFTSNLNNELLF